ncbi:hypothetical protein PR003_g18764 [Phytophthora rubi]|uniref:Uncharacterized protein n=1 Tax=Phytophthora rubi TaxID=129364 RepID=A0A6A4E4R0_9STRA|nr:hypothetical protein PR003_g18764 [Phytophthora rubi]
MSNRGAERPVRQESKGAEVEEHTADKGPRLAKQISGADTQPWETVHRRTAGAQRTTGLKQETKRAPTMAKDGQGPQTGARRRWERDGDRSRGDQGDGKVVFAQLRDYLCGETSADYCIPLVVKLASLAKARRFQEHYDLLPKDMKDKQGEQELRESWKDLVPQDILTKHAEWENHWDLNRTDDARRLTELMKGWIAGERLSQKEVEDRLRVQYLEGLQPNSEGGKPDSTIFRSYKGAVSQGLHKRETKKLTEEQSRLRDLCLRPAKALTQLRQRTADEDAALLMIMSQEIEVPRPPNFLVQSMNAGEIARFTDLFWGIEYPLYAHLMPGQWFGENLTKQAILAHIHTGAEAAPKQKQDVEQFKDSLSRITLDMDTRVITVTFKGRGTARSWANWKMPMAGKMLQLIDYERESEAERISHEMVQLDYYTFTAEVKRGKVTSTDMHWILAQSMGLQVQTMVHPEAGRAGLNDKRWTVTIKGAGCPRKLRNIALLQTTDAEILIWHHSVHVGIPCSNCLSQNHQTRYCREPVGNIGARRKSHTWRFGGPSPSSQGTGGRDYRPLDPPKTLEQLLGLLQGAEITRSRPVNVAEGGAAAETPPEATKTSQVNPREDALPTSPKEGSQQHTWSPGDKIDNKSAGEIGGSSGKAPAAQTTEQSSGKFIATAGPTSSDNATSVESDTAIDDDMGGDAASRGDEEDRARGTEEIKKPETESKRRSGEGEALAKTRASVGERKENTANVDTVENIKQRGRGQDVATTEQRRSSLSPKRRAPVEWTEDDCAQGVEDQREGGSTGGSARSLSPTKRAKGVSIKKERHTSQQFIHQFLHKVIEGTNPKQGQLGNERQQQEVGVDDVEMHGPTDDDDCKAVDVQPPTDAGAFVDEWLSLLGGTIADVASNGQCRWLAFYAALYNVKEGLVEPTVEVIDAANALKKQVMNGMLANLEEEAKLHLQDIKAEAMALGSGVTMETPMEDVLYTLADHYVAQRKKSVNSTVPRHFRGEAGAPEGNGYSREGDALRTGRA